MGKRSQMVGASFEAVMNFACTIYRNRQQALIEPNGVRGEWRWSSRDNQRFFKAWPRDKQPPDFAGVIDGRYVCFDAKTTTNKQRWTLKKDSYHQLESMVAFAAHGGLSWFAVEYREHDLLILRKVKADQPVGRLTVDLGGYLSGAFNDGKLLLMIEQKDGWYDWLPRVKKHWL